MNFVILDLIVEMHKAIIGTQCVFLFKNAACVNLSDKSVSLTYGSIWFSYLATAFCWNWDNAM